MLGIAVIFCSVIARNYGDMYLLRVCIIPVVIILSVLTMHQNTFWRSEVALFERMDKYEPNFGRGQLLLAKAYYFAKRYDLANAHFAAHMQS